MVIYRAEIWCSFDSCTEFWESCPLGDFHTTREGAERDIEPLRGLKRDKLEKAMGLIKGFRTGWPGDNTPKVEVYDLIEDTKTQEA